MKSKYILQDGKKTDCFSFDNYHFYDNFCCKSTITATGPDGY